MDGGLGDAIGQRKGVEKSSLVQSVQAGAHAQCLERPGFSRGRVWGSSLRLCSVSRLVGTGSAGLLSPFHVAMRVPGGCNGVSAGTALVSGALRPGA